MTALPLLQAELVKLGYSSIEQNYVFADVFSSLPSDKVVPLAAFTDTPPSYRNAALAVVEARPGEPPEKLVSQYRALGAPLLFSVEGDQVVLWQVRPERRPTMYRSVSLDQVPALFAEKHEVWSPGRIRSAKSLGLLDKAYQLDFIDAGLLPAIEGEIHSKLDRLLTETLAETVRLRVIRPGEPADDRLVFRTVFRLLAAKVLQDRGHEWTTAWNADDVDSVLRGISSYYELPPLPGENISFRNTVFEPAWLRLREGISFRNISSDDLAFVYENTLVTDETREHFGTHSTPRQLAEYVVSHMALWERDIWKVRVYEPFAGSGVFMVAALKQLRDLLPENMSERERHNFLVQRVRGAEIDAFAAEVARLSLILADYPNENGWEVEEINLFKNDLLRHRASRANVILCNPPFEQFKPEERESYPEASRRSYLKPAAALSAVLEARPDALGFVLPAPFVAGDQYEEHRRRVEALYKAIELVALPDNIFKASVVRSSLLIAREPRSEGDLTTSLRSTVVLQRDRARFLKTGEVSDTRTRVRPMSRAMGSLWVEELQEVWEYLASAPRLESIADVHKGVEWQGGQADAVSDHERPFSRPGIHAANAIHAFALNRPVHLDWRPESFRPRAAAYRWPWDKPKLLANAARISRGPWCFAAAADRSGLVASQQLFGIWPKTGLSLDALSALLNGPVAVGYIATHSPPDRIRVNAVESVPLPKAIPGELDELVLRYVAILDDPRALFGTESNESAAKALNDIDAAVLEAYDLPPRLERQLLEYFRNDDRPTMHAWTHWFPENFQAYVPLRMYLSDAFKRAASGWVLNVFRPLPEEEAAALREYLD